MIATDIVLDVDGMQKRFSKTVAQCELLYLRWTGDRIYLQAAEQRVKSNYTIIESSNGD